jgi:hypothetical protein
MDGAVPPLPQYAFMAWCSVRGSKGTTFTFILACYLKIFDGSQFGIVTQHSTLCNLCSVCNIAINNLGAERWSFLMESSRFLANNLCVGGGGCNYCDMVMRDPNLVSLRCVFPVLHNATSLTWFILTSHTCHNIWRQRNRSICIHDTNICVTSCLYRVLASHLKVKAKIKVKPTSYHGGITPRILILALDGGEWSPSRPGRFITRGAH